MGIVVAVIEDVAHATSFDKVVHTVTGGERLLERDGRVSPGVVQGLEKAFSDCGLDRIVHLVTGGNRVVNLDGTFNHVGMLKCARALAELAVNPGAVGPARAMGVVYQEVINLAIKALNAADPESAENVKKIRKLKALAKTCAAVIENPLGNLLELPGLAEKLLDLSKSA